MTPVHVKSLAVGSIILALWATSSPAGDFSVAARLNTVGYEAELQYASVGLLFAKAPNVAKSGIAFGGGGGCTETYDYNYTALRYFPFDPYGGFYLGVGLQTIEVASHSGTCTFPSQDNEQLFLIGYRTHVESGFEFDIGARPGGVAVGYTYRF